MNESAGTLGMEYSSLGSFIPRWDEDVLANERLYSRNNAALGVLLAGMCYGVIDVIIFIMAVFCGNIHTGHLTVFKVSLTFTRILQILSTPLVAVELFGSDCSLRYCYKLSAVWLVSRRCGVILHLLVALEFLLIRRQSRLGSKILRLHWCLPVVLTLDLICILFIEVLEAAVFFGTAAATLTCLILILACCASGRMDNPSILVVSFALLTFGVTYCPSFVLECMALGRLSVSGSLYEIFLCLTNLRLATDGWLFRAICKEAPEAAPQRINLGQVNLDPVSQVPE